MTLAIDHYDHLLAEHYTWMLGGDIEDAASGQERLLGELDLRADADDDVAVDLGCGPGPQTLALLRLGFAEVVAVDTSARLLGELTAHAEDTGVSPRIRPVRGDLRGVLPREVEPGTAAAVVCMGDTLPHLPSKADVPRLLGDVADALRPGGRFVATYRDFTREVRGTDRFIPVRSAEERLLTCFLDVLDEDTVMVYDLLHVRSGDGWRQRVSGYPKLRLGEDWLIEQCRTAGLEVRHAGAGPRGLRVLDAARP
ncbi:class I SAM-dependent methyltransferase [Streptomyces sp. JJ38]|uniref:class I SAM-dependent methyltransferase n=1 Tax=Streptomyces sp. JJ38 TaxID=2738128 RepID=UPI001C57E9B4|nr:class I SAM-dependent methyltransferase [Streptomyces sp. JJ38]MBW1596179.1 class I SAM-dependent methyltransferase [Streptomyces sp. JJ38]